MTPGPITVVTGVQCSALVGGPYGGRRGNPCGVIRKGRRRRRFDLVRFAATRNGKAADGADRELCTLATIKRRSKDTCDTATGNR